MEDNAGDEGTINKIAGEKKVEGVGKQGRGQKEYADVNFG